MGNEGLIIIEKATAITVRCSDAPKNTPVNVIRKFVDKESEMTVIAISDGQIERLIV